MIRAAFFEQIKQVKRTDPLLSAGCRPLCAVVYQAALLRFPGSYRPINCIRLLPVHVIEKRPSRMMIDISLWICDQLSD